MGSIEDVSTIEEPTLTKEQLEKAIAAAAIEAEIRNGTLSPCVEAMKNLMGEMSDCDGLRAPLDN